MIRRNTWILLAVFVLLLAVLFILQQQGEESPDEAAVPTTVVRSNLFSFSIDEVTGFRIESQEGLVVEAEKAGEVWQLVQPETGAGEVDQTRVEGLIAQLASIRLLTEGDIIASLSDLQLQSPPYRLAVGLAGGERVDLAIGSSSVTNTGYYVSLDGGPPSLVSKSVLDSFIGLLDTPPLLPTPIPSDGELPESGSPEVTP